MIGHSQGGMLARYVAVRRGRLGVVDDIVGLAPSSHGTTQPLAGPAGVFGCTACARAAGRLGVHAQGQRAAARGARPRLVHGGHHHARRGRHALPVAGARRRPRDERDPPGPLSGRRLRARHDRRRPGRAAVGDQRARAPRARPTRASSPTAPGSAPRPLRRRLRVTLGRRAAKRQARTRRDPRALRRPGGRALHRPARERPPEDEGVPRSARGSASVVRLRVGKARRVRAVLPQPGGGVAGRSRAATGCAERSRHAGSGACTTT